MKHSDPEILALVLDADDDSLARLIAAASGERVRRIDARAAAMRDRPKDPVLTAPKLRALRKAAHAEGNTILSSACTITLREVTRRTAGPCGTASRVAEQARTTVIAALTRTA